MVRKLHRPLPLRQKKTLSLRMGTTRIHRSLHHRTRRNSTHTFFLRMIRFLMCLPLLCSTFCLRRFWFLRSIPVVPIRPLEFFSVELKVVNVTVVKGGRSGSGQCVSGVITEVRVEAWTMCQKWSESWSGQKWSMVRSGQKWLIVVNSQKATVVTAVKVQRGTIVQRGSQWQ